MKPAISTVVAVCLALTVACSSQPETIAPGTPLVYDDGVVSFTYPSNWDLLSGLTTGAGVAADGPAVGWIDSAGNLIGLAIQVQTANPAPPAGEERGYLEAVVSRSGTGIWGSGVARGEGWALLDSPVADHEAIGAVIDVVSRGEDLTTAVTAFVDGSSLVVIQCQAPASLFDLLAPHCATVLGSLEIQSSGDSTG